MPEERHQLKSRFVFVMPALAVLLLVTVAVVDFGIPQSSELTPFFAAMAIFYWGVLWPRALPTLFVFMLGLYQDLLYGMPLGITSLANLLLWWMVVSQRRLLVKESFFVMWVVFGLASFIYALLNWGLHTAYYQKFLFSITMILQWLLSVLIYPFVHKLFNWIHGMLVKQSQL